MDFSTSMHTTLTLWLSLSFSDTGYAHDCNVIFREFIKPFHVCFNRKCTLEIRWQSLTHFLISFMISNSNLHDNHLKDNFKLIKDMHPMDSKVRYLYRSSAYLSKPQHKRRQSKFSALMNLARLVGGNRCIYSN